MYTTGTKQDRQGGTDSLGSRTCFSCLLLLQSARMLHAAPSHLLTETSRCIIPASPFPDFPTALGWQFRPCKAEEKPDCSPPQEMLTTSPVNMSTISQKRGSLLCEVTVLGDSPCWFSSRPQCPRCNPTVGAGAPNRCENPSAHSCSALQEFSEALP